MFRGFDWGPGRLVGFVMACLAGLWLWLFMLPLGKLALLNSPTSLLPVFAVLVVAQWLPWRILRLLAAIAATYGYILHYFVPHDVFLWTGIRMVTGYEVQQLLALMHGGNFTDPLQTHLFLFAVCALYWLIVYATERVRLWLFYNLLGVIVLAIVDANTAVHPDLAMVLVLLLCVTVLGLSQYRRLGAGMGHRGMGSRFFAPLTALAVFGLLVGLLVPKQGPVWADPFRTAGTGGVGGHTVQVIGYQSDNSHLGGSFVLDHTQVLSVVTQYPSYLRGEAYTEYTGKGWLAGPREAVTYHLGSSLNDTGVDATAGHGKDVMQRVTVLSGGLHASVLFGGFTVDKVVSDSLLSQGTPIEYDPTTNTVYGAELHEGMSYVLQSYEVQSPGSFLAGLPPMLPGAAAGWPYAVKLNLQLPDHLPARVATLAHQLTNGLPNEYAKVEAVLQYLQSNYQYTTQNVPVPGPTDDYVDQFLFESKQGYCNNFSSSMAVLLRCVGIPARWVTGFTDGRIDSSYSGSGTTGSGTTGPETRYLLENVDAHSWVEVYFPQVGWIPFDPTPNFSMPYLPIQSTATTPGVVNATSPDTPRKPPVPLPSDGGSPSSSGGVDWSAIFHALEWIAGGCATLVALGLIFFRRRVAEFRHLLAWRGEGPHGMSRGIAHLVRILRKYGEIPDRPATVRDLSQAAKSYGIEEEAYRRFVTTAERTWYAGEIPPKPDLESAKGVWRRWISAIVKR